MRTVIEEIFDGEKYRTENIVRSEKYKQLQKTTLILYEKFIETLTEEQKTMFEEVLDKMFELNDVLTKTDLVDGVK